MSAGEYGSEAMANTVAVLYLITRAEQYVNSLSHGLPSVIELQNTFIRMIKHDSTLQNSKVLKGFSETNSKYGPTRVA